MIDRAKTTAILKTVRRTGLMDPIKLGALGGAGVLWGPSVATPYAAAAIRHPNRAALVDDYGTLTYRQLDWRSTRVAGALNAAGVKRGVSVGLLCRNHRGFVEANLAAAKLGARVVYLNTGLPAGQLDEVVAREQISHVIADREFVNRLGDSSGGISVIVAAPEDEESWTFPELKRWRMPMQMPRPWKIIDPILLTSGTSGAPKGAERSSGADAAGAAMAFLEAIPLQKGDVFSIPAPLFHGWGISQLLVAATLSGTVLLRRAFDPVQIAADIEAHGAEVLVAVPVMLHRMLEVDVDYDLSTLRITETSGSALPGDLATRWMDSFGDNLYNMYGSTEVGQVSVATPEHLRANPASGGTPLRGIGLRILDDDAKPVHHGQIGRIAIKSPTLFDGYTSGGTKEVCDEHMLIGDQGYLDVDGTLIVVGRADDMIISGGENVYPINIERRLLSHRLVSDAAVVGVPNADLGHKVRAVIVPVDEASPALTKKLKAHLALELAPYEMPREYVYVKELPRNLSGKTLRSKLMGSLSSLKDSNNEKVAK